MCGVQKTPWLQTDPLHSDTNNQEHLLISTLRATNQSLRLESPRSAASSCLWVEGGKHQGYGDSGDEGNRSCLGPFVALPHRKSSLAKEGAPMVAPWPRRGTQPAHPQDTGGHEAASSTCSTHQPHTGLP